MCAGTNIMSEFALIEKWFTWRDTPPNVLLGVGDDAALLAPSQHEALVVTVDTSISGVHFPNNTPAHAVGYKSLAVNLSDLAAMGAKPLWFTLALTLPEANQQWLNEFAQGLQAAAKPHQIFLVGGDTTRGSLSITIQVIGSVPADQALLRSGAQIGDVIAVSGTLGDAAAGLACHQQRLYLPTADANYCLQRLHYPTPRLALGKVLKNIASSCIDISDGLLADLQHILQASQVGAQLDTNKIPFSSALKRLKKEQRLSFALNGGDDYELLFTIAPEKLPQLHDQAEKISEAFSGGFSIIGTINDKKNSLKLDNNYKLSQDGYDHFR